MNYRTIIRLLWYYVGVLLPNYIIGLCSTHIKNQQNNIIKHQGVPPLVSKGLILH